MQTVKDSPGVELFILEDLTEFQNAVKPVYEFFQPQYGDLIALVQAETGK